MARRARQRISYVLPLANSAGGHRLGINGLAIDNDNSILYSGGRDGVICAWDLNLDLHNPPRPTSASEGQESPAPPATTFRHQVQAHTHWINDIVLVQSNQALVSASSDISVKIWRPAGQDPPQTIGLHNDYVKVLASPDQNTNWVASGGLDRKIYLWDVHGKGQTLSIDVGLEEGASGLGRDKGSVYALATTHSIIASGGPESVVRLWDPRSGKRITKFVGHTDNVRDVLISADGATVMTASSDQTVKVWSVTAGRCMNTLTMHDASVWSLSSDHPQLSVFYSSDRSGLVAKTDTRSCTELEEGLSIALCQEHESVHKVAVAGDHLWTATSRPSINRWKDFNTDGAEVEMPGNFNINNNRLSLATIATSRSRLPSPHSHAYAPMDSPWTTTTGENKIPLKHVLRLTNTAYYPRPSTRDNGVDQADDAEAEDVQPIRHAPESHIEGQSGLIKHYLLHDRKRVLTLDTAGEVLMWDLLKCKPIQSFGKRHLEDVAPEVNTVESVPNWCAVDTRTGSLTITLEENNAFDAEMYADELDIQETIDFREDQRINLGKWVLRYLFANLIDEQVRRDQQFRHHLLQKAKNQKLERENAPTSIQLPPMNHSNGWHDSSAPLTASTLKAVNGNSTFTPGLAIGQATPGFFTSPAKPINSGPRAPSESSEGAPLTKTTSRQSQQGRKSSDKASSDYFSTLATETTGLTSPTEAAKAPMTPGAEEGGDGAKDTPSKFGKKFKMNMSAFSMKKLARVPTNDPATAMKLASDNDGTSNSSNKDAETESDSRSSKTSHSRNVDDNFQGCVQKIRFAYEDDITSQIQRQTAQDAAGGALGAVKDLELPSLITPSMPSETPVLKPPTNTTILIQEDRPEAGGVLDLWEGKVGKTGEAAQVDLLEKCAPMWLGDVLLRNMIPPKDIVKISFVLEPWKGLLPLIGTEGNNRLNANRMLRARKILAYVAERIEPGSASSTNPGTTTLLTSPTTPTFPHHTTTTTTTNSSSSSTIAAAPPPDDHLKPEDYLELYCNGQLLPPKMTLASIRTHVWRSGGDVVLHYKANGRKAILHAPKAAIPGDGADAGGAVASGGAAGGQGAAGMSGGGEVGSDHFGSA